MNIIPCRTVLRRVLIIVFFVITLLAVIVPTWNMYMSEGRETFLIDYTNPSVNQNQSLTVDASILDVDFDKKTYTIHFVLQPHGTLINSQGQLMYDTILSISPSQQKYTYHTGDMFMSFQEQLHYDDGNPIDYPFDRYTGSFRIEASITIPSDNTSNTTSQFSMIANQTQWIPLSFRLEASLTSFSFEPRFTAHNKSLSLEIMTARSTTTLGFSIFMCFLMWALSLVMAIFGYQVLFHQRRVHVHDCMLGITMLFALPALRSAQPGVPEVGCISDVVGFYWNMAIIALESIIILGCWVARWDEKEDKHQKGQVLSDQSNCQKNITSQHIEHLDP